MKDERAYLLHIRDAIDRILSYTKEGRDTFLGDSMIQDAVLRNMEILGEASKRVQSLCASVPRACRGARWPGCATS